MTDDGELDPNLRVRRPKTDKSPGENRGGLPEDASDVTLALYSDCQFQKAMHAAIAAGLECAPTTVSTAPCTKRPIFIPLDKATLFGASSLRSF